MTNWQWFLVQLKHVIHDWGPIYMNPDDYNEQLRDCRYEHCSAKRRYRHVKGYWWTTSW